MICNRCLQPFERTRYGHGETVCPVCADELEAESTTPERDEEPARESWWAGKPNDGDEHNPEGQR